MKVAVVSNKRDIKNDYSKFIDSCDVVIRVSKMDNIDSGKTGSKTDIVVLVVNDCYMTFTPEQRHLELLKQVPKVYLVGGHQEMNIQSKVYARKHKLNWEMFPYQKENPHFTTFASAVYLAVKNFPDAEIYFLGDVSVALRTDNAHWHRPSQEEQMFRVLIEQGKLKPILNE